MGKTFLLIWVGQLVSIIGSGTTAFALGVWVYQETGSVTRFALISLTMVLPVLLLSPLAGVMVDRWDRRRIMILSDAGAGLCTLTVFLLASSGRLETWHVYVISAVLSIANTFQGPAYGASIPLLVAPEHLARANGLAQMGQAARNVLSPVLGGALIVTVGLHGVLLLDFITFLFAVGVLLLVRIPVLAGAGSASGGSLVGEAARGWTYLVARTGLVGLLALLAISNFLQGQLSVLFTPLVLAVASPASLGTVTSLGGLGMLLGGITLSVWGGLKKRMHTVLLFLFLSGLATLIGGVHASLPIFVIGVFGYLFAAPFINGCSMAIWQSKVALAYQGRVMALSGMIVGVFSPLGFIVAGPLADKLFEPLLADDGALAGSLGQVIGVGPGRGIGLMFVVIGLLTMLLALAGWLHPRIRRLETELPDAIPAD